MRLTHLIPTAKTNNDFRRVLATGQHTQVVVMSIPAGGEIGSEVHPDNDQLLLLVAGSGRAIVDGETWDIAAGDAVLVPAGSQHNLLTAGDAPMQIVTTYSPPHHADGTVHHTKADADAAE